MHVWSKLYWSTQSYTKEPKENIYDLKSETNRVMLDRFTNLKEANKTNDENIKPFKAFLQAFEYKLRSLLIIEIKLNTKTVCQPNIESQVKGGNIFENIEKCKTSILLTLMTWVTPGTNHL